MDPSQAPVQSWPKEGKTKKKLRVQGKAKAKKYLATDEQGFTRIKKSIFWENME